MKKISILFFICLAIVAVSCTATAAKKQQIVLKLVDSETESLLFNVQVSIYDGYDRRLSPYGSDPKPNNEPYHFADLTTSSDGTIQIDLSKLKDNTIFLKCGKWYKYIHHNKSSLLVMKYNRVGKYSLQVVFHHLYNIDSGLVEITPIITHGNPKKPYGSWGERGDTTTQRFSVIEVPMDY